MRLQFCSQNCSLPQISGGSNYRLQRAERSSRPKKKREELGKYRTRLLLEASPTQTREKAIGLHLDKVRRNNGRRSGGGEGWPTDHRCPRRQKTSEEGSRVSPPYRDSSLERKSLLHVDSQATWQNC
jgi:hypothetical protein